MAHQADDSAERGAHHAATHPNMAAAPAEGNAPIKAHNPLETKGTASIFSSTANLANTVIGAGLIAMPGAMKYTGLIPGIVLILFCGFTSLSGLYLLTRCAARIGGRDTSFYNVAKKTLPSGARWFDLAIALKCYGVSISYLIICSSLASGGARDAGGLTFNYFSSRRRATHAPSHDILLQCVRQGSSRDP